MSLQKTRTTRHYSSNVFFYGLVLTFHFLVLFTNTGNYFHRGTVFEFIALHAMAALILYAGYKLAQTVNLNQKIIIFFSCITPASSLSLFLFYSLRDN